MAYPTSGPAGITLEDFEAKVTQLGLEVLDSDGCTRRLVKSGAPIVASDCIVIDSGTNIANSITHALAAGAGLIGVCPFSVSCSTSGQYFWAVMNGPAKVRVAASCQPNVPLYTTDTAGVLDDSTISLTGFQVMGAMLNNGVSNSSVGNSALQGTFNNPLIRVPKNA